MYSTKKFFFLGIVTKNAGCEVPKQLISKYPKALFGSSKVVLG